MQHFMRYAFFALAVSAVPAMNKRDDDESDVNAANIVRATTNLLVQPLATARASAVIAQPAANPARPTAPVIATVEGPVPTQLPNGLYQCGSGDDGIARYYQNTRYTCFDGDILCPILTNGRRTRPCGDACFDPASYSCGDDNRLLSIPCAQNDDCDDNIDFQDADDININRNAVSATATTLARVARPTTDVNNDDSEENEEDD
jgi:hypothetical protein